MISYTPCCSIIIKSFSSDTVGLLSGLIQTCQATGPLVYTIVFNAYFFHGGVYEDQDLQGLFFFITCLNASTHVIGVIAFGFQLEETEDFTDYNRLHYSDDRSSGKNDDNKSIKRHNL